MSQTKPAYKYSVTFAKFNPGATPATRVTVLRNGNPQNYAVVSSGERGASTKDGMAEIVLNRKEITLKPTDQRPFSIVLPSLPDGLSYGSITVTLLENPLWGDKLTKNGLKAIKDKNSEGGAEMTEGELAKIAYDKAQSLIS